MPRNRPERVSIEGREFEPGAVYAPRNGRGNCRQLLAFEPIKSGIENTNYFVTTAQGRYVLTLFERLPAAELPFYLDLMAHLARHGIPCPAPIADLSDRYLQELNGKPAVLVTRLPGKSIEHPGVADCAELGRLLGRMHLAGRSYGGYLENPRGPKWWRFAAKEVAPFLDARKKELLEKEMDFQAGHRFPDLPRGPVHADPVDRRHHHARDRLGVLHPRRAQGHRRDLVVRAQRLGRDRGQLGIARGLQVELELRHVGRSAVELGDERVDHLAPART